MANRFRQFRLLLWKNFILQLRRPVGSVFEILLPVLMISILILPKRLIEVNDVCFTTFIPAFQSVKIPINLKAEQMRLNGKPMLNSSASLLLAYYPVNSETTKVMKYVEMTTAIFNATSTDVKGKVWSSEEHMAKEASELEEKYMGAIVFDIGSTATKLPKSVKYSIRLSHNLGGGRKSWRTERTYPGFNSPGPRSGSLYTPRFLALQYAVDMAIIRLQANVNYSIPVKLQQLPHPGYRVDFFIQTVAFLMPLLVTLAFIYSAVMIIKEIVFEKQNRLKESMKMMGLANWIHWSAWFMKNLLFLLISVVLITIVVKAFAIFENSDGLLIFIILLLFAMATILFGFFISTIFSNAVLSMLFGAVIWFGSLVPYLMYNSEEAYDGLSKSAKASICLLPTSCLGIATRIIMTFEGNKIGVQWSNVADVVSADDSFSLALVLVMFLVECLLFGTLTWYIEGVFPGTYGIPKPFYFPFQKSYWCGISQDQVITTAGEMGPVEPQKDKDHAHEEEPHNLPIGVGIKDLRKVFKGSTGSKVAVDGLSLNMFQGQITALLGHNGAGKTTTMSVLTGLYTPTSGSAHINQRSILTDMDAIRDSLGLCPQHNVLFDRLTVKEHLIFFINLKGVYGPDANFQVQEMIEDLQLVDKANWASTQLSGGMKRKLSCAIALIGGSKTVFLDEPTSGMDPYARRATWDLLLKHKEGRTMVLTTHFMDEADFLGDRIAIMADGQLRCSGSSLFLKSRYGVGYHLTLVKQEGCDENLQINCVKRHVPSAQIISNVGAEIEFILESSSSHLFEELFMELETKRSEYGVNSFGVSVTTMEEVFMKVGEGQEKTVDDIPLNSTSEGNSTNATNYEAVHDHEHQIEDSGRDQMVQISNSEKLDPGVLLTGASLVWQQYKAMLMKRFLNSKREKKAVITQFLLPCLLVIFGLLLINAIPTRDNDKPRLLQLSNLSVNNEPTKAFFADFRNSSNKGDALTKAKTYLETVKVDATDVASSVLNIKNANSVNVSIRGNVFALTANMTNCCNYEFLILNPTCRQKFISGDLKPEDCKSYKTFGYTECPKCINVPAPNKDCNAVGCNGTNLADIETYITEHVLEESNDRDYFLTHVAGFSFTSPLPTKVGGTNAKIPTVNSTSNVTLPTNGTLPNNGTAPSKVGTLPDQSPYWATVWFSNEALHTIAEALSAMSNILLMEETNDTSYSIETTNFPLPNSLGNKVENVSTNGAALNLAIFLALGMAYMAASFITFIVRERVTKAKHIQIVSGVNPIAYWFGTYTWDFLNYLIPAILILILFAAFQVEAFEGENLGVVFLFLIEFGLVVLPFVYCWSYVFKSPLIAYAVTVFILSLLSLAMLIAVFVCRIPSLGVLDEAEIMHYVFLLFPTYALSYALIDMSDNHQFKKTCTATVEAKLYCDRDGVNYVEHALEWDRPGVGQIALYMFIEAVVLMVLTLLIEVNFFIGQRVHLSTEEYESRRKTEEDEDVYAERHRVNSMDKDAIGKESVVMKDLTKVYGGKAMTAVDHLSLAIPRGECFGLLGINGAGKTTTFNMLTGDLGITEGTAFIDGYDIQKHLRQVQQRLGYCPQFDALIDRLTGREMLTMYARLRGISDDKIDEVVSVTIEQLSLGKWADKLCGNYSGGNKRKLSTAIALVGNPPIVFLDEPTTGMDPVTRRFLWNALTEVMKGGRSIVLTSHSMEECEALCTRLAIMVNGQFKCLGSTQHLKSRFGKGYTLMIKVGPVPVQSDGLPSQPPPQVQPQPPPPLQAEPQSPPPAQLQTPPSSSVPVVNANPAPAQGLPAVNHPEQDNGLLYTNGSVVNTGDVKPTMPPSQTPPQYMVQPVGAQPLIFDRGLMQAVCNAKHFVSTSFEGAVLMDEHQGMLQYQVQNERLSWSYIFGQLERYRKVLNILDYSVSQTTLEQVFINFAKEQHSEERTAVKSRCCGCCTCCYPAEPPEQTVIIANPNT